MKIVVQVLFVEKSKLYKGVMSLELWRDPVMVTFSDKIYSFSRWEFY
jgi:hypothetical protein